VTLPLACPTILNRSYSSALIYYKTTTPASLPMSIKDCQSLDLLYVSTSLITETSTNRNTNFIINIYSDSNQTARQYLQQNIINLEGTIILTGDLNIRDMSWLGKTAKSLFIFLFFSFSFSFNWTYNYKVEHGKESCDFVTMSQWCDGWSQMVMSWVTVTVCRMTRVTWGP